MDINSGAADSAPDHLTDVDGTLYFSANDGKTGTEVWKAKLILNPEQVPAAALPGLILLATGLAALFAWLLKSRSSPLSMTKPTQS